MIRQTARRRKKFIIFYMILENDSYRQWFSLDFTHILHSIRNIDITKSKLEAKFYSAYIDQIINWDDFCELCEITTRLFVSDIGILRKAYRNGGVSESSGITYKHDRLVSIGLLTNEAPLHGGVVAFDLDNLEQQNIMELTEIGRKFCNIAFRLYV